MQAAVGFRPPVGVTSAPTRWARRSSRAVVSSRSAWLVGISQTAVPRSCSCPCPCPCSCSRDGLHGVGVVSAWQQAWRMAPGVGRDAEEKQHLFLSRPPVPEIVLTQRPLRPNLNHNAGVVVWQSGSLTARTVPRSLPRPGQGYHLAVFQVWNLPYLINFYNDHHGLAGNSAAWIRQARRSRLFECASLASALAAVCFTRRRDRDVVRAGRCEFVPAWPTCYSLLAIRTSFSHPSSYMTSGRRAGWGQRSVRSTLSS